MSKGAGEAGVSACPVMTILPSDCTRTPRATSWLPLGVAGNVPSAFAGGGANGAGRRLMLATPFVPNSASREPSERSLTSTKDWSAEPDVVKPTA